MMDDLPPDPFFEEEWYAKDNPTGCARVVLLCLLVEVIIALAIWKKFF